MPLLPSLSFPSALIPSLLDYRLHLTPVQFILSTVTRVIFLKHKLAHIPPLLKILQFLTRAFRIKFQTSQLNTRNLCVSKTPVLPFPSIPLHSPLSTLRKSSVKMSVATQTFPAPEEGSQMGGMCHSRGYLAVLGGFRLSHWHLMGRDQGCW